MEIPTIIDSPTYATAQMRLQGNAMLSNRNAKRVYLLKGRIRCGWCGQKMYGIPSHGKRYYRCSHRDTTLTVRCSGRTVNADTAEGLVWQEILTLLQDPALIMQGLETQAVERRRDLGQSFREVELIEAVERTVAGLQDRREQLQERLKVVELDEARVTAIGDYVDRVQKRLTGFSDKDKQLALEALDIDITWTGEALKVNVAIPVDTGVTAPTTFS